MRAKLIALGAVVTALAVAPAGTALADEPPGGADQTASNAANAQSTNTSTTLQGADQSQSSSSSCGFGCGGSGQAQALEQSAETTQVAASEADADQTAVNANVPVTISAGGHVGGDNSATQTADNSADASSTNDAVTKQGADQSQDASSHCVAGCGGSGQAQELSQDASTEQVAKSKADADGTAINANVPVTITAGAYVGGDNSASQDASNSASADSSNSAWTGQFASHDQSSSSSCKFGCGGSGQAQKLSQDAATFQLAFSDADADGTAINANVPVTIAGGGYLGGDSSASQTANNSADASSTNDAVTKQGAEQSQEADSHCFAGCGGSGQAQDLSQSAVTEQLAFSFADAEQVAENTNAAVKVKKPDKGKKAKRSKQRKHGKKGHPAKR